MFNVGDQKWNVLSAISFFLFYNEAMRLLKVKVTGVIVSLTATEVLNRSNDH